MQKIPQHYSDGFYRVTFCFVPVRCDDDNGDVMVCRRTMLLMSVAHINSFIPLINKTPHPILCNNAYLIAVTLAFERKTKVFLLRFHCFSSVSFLKTIPSYKGYFNWTSPFTFFSPIERNYDMLLQEFRYYIYNSNVASYSKGSLFIFSYSLHSLNESSLEMRNKF